MIKQVQKVITLLLVWISLPVFLLVTNPETLPLPLLIIPFVLLFAVLYISAKTIIKTFLKDVPAKRRQTMAVVFALLPTLLILLASIRQLTVRDIAIIFGLLILLMFYLRRVDFLKNS
jgi:hypothetical protein